MTIALDGDTPSIALTVVRGTDELTITVTF